jgi:hypothetical protein
MKIFNELTSDNFEFYAAKHYKNPSCLDIKDFKDDLARFKYINRLLRKYENTGVLSERLILNHIIILYNVFDIQGATRMLFYRVSVNHWGTIKAFLLYLNYLTDDQKREVTIDLYAAKKLQSI